nr:DUF3267 domain-containing protein [Bacillus sp. DNRA2]
MPKYNQSLHSELIKNEWVPLKEPRNLISTFLLSIPLMIINGIFSIGILNIFSNVSLKDFGIYPNSVSFTINLEIILFTILLVIFHEFLHLIFIPNFIKSKNTIIGIHWLGGFVATEEKIQKSRFILVAVAPFVIISVVLTIILGVCGLLNSTLKSLVILNSLASSVDILLFLLIITQVPKNGLLISNGNKTYWKS